MATIVTRSGKGSPLTHAEVDANFTNLNTDKIQSGDTVASLDINGGTIDGTVIGGSTPAAISGTSGAFSGGVSSGGLVVNGAASVAGGLSLPASTTEARSIEVGTGRTGDGNSFVDLIGDATYTDYGARFFRGGGANGSTQIAHRGTGPLALTTDEAAAITLLTDSAERMRITSTGNVGIGTSSPSARLDVTNTSGSSIIEINAENNSASQLRFGDSDDPDIGLISYSHALNTLQIFTNNAEAMRITSTGSVGIGTSSPTTALHVNASSGLRVSGSTGNFFAGDNLNLLDAGTLNSGAVYFGTVDTTNPTAGIEASWGGATLPQIHIGITRDGNKTRYSAFLDNTLRMYTGDSERLRITSTGSVGIGTSNPASKLHVVGSFRQTGVTVPFEWTVNAGATDYLKLNAVGFTDNLIVARSNGNVGIGTSSPTNLLDVNADSIRVRTAQTPATAGAAGNQGEIAWDADYIYVCVATNTWKRVAIATW